MALPFRVTPSEGRGMIAVATRPIAAGEVVLDEPPLWIAPAQPEHRFKHVDKFCLETSAPPHPVYAALQYFELPEEQQRRFLDLFCPTSEQAKAGAMAPLVDRVAELAMPPGVTHDFFLQLALRWDANCIQVNESDDTAVYPLACRINHACRPNCYWHSAETHRLVRAVQDIAEGEELTVSYLCGEELLRPTAFRRAVLWQTKYFWCECGRCGEPDLTRKFPCSSCSDGFAVPAPQARPGTIPTETGAWFLVQGPLVCRSCSAVFPEARCQELLATEKLLLNKWQLLETTPSLRREEVMMKTLSEVTNQLHPEHWVANELYDMLVDFNTQRSSWTKAAAFLVRRRKHMAGIHVGALPQVWWAEEALGRCLAHFASDAVAAALTCYRRAQTALRALYPEEHPYVRDLREKAAALEARTVVTCSSCGKAKGEGQVFKRCTQCRCVMYCEEACQKQHWKPQHAAECRVLKAILEAVAELDAAMEI
eukprot:EG_transcript_8391